MDSNTKVQKALRHINDLFPAVTQVFFGADGRWLYCDEDFNAPDFHESVYPVALDLLDEAADAAGEEKGFPCAFRLLTLADYYELFDAFGNIPVADAEGEPIEEPFLDFPVATPRAEIWHWFEAQHPDFVIGEVLQGIRKPTGATSWKVILTMENGADVEWVGTADDLSHAEGQAIAIATSTTGEQVFSIKSAVQLAE